MTLRKFTLYLSARNIFCMTKTLIVIAILILFCLSKTYSQSQIWHLSTDTLKYPKSFGSGEVAMAFINQYDTVPCLYRINGDESVYKGYKLIYKKNGFYIDDNTTLNIFFDNRIKRIQNVHQFILN